jgi:hypothetical protein
MNVAVRERHVPCTVPDEAELAGAQIDLLHYAVEDLLLTGAALRLRVHRPDLVGDHDRSAALGDLEFVLVGCLARVAVHPLDDLVVRVEDEVGADADARVVRSAVAQPVGQHLLALVGLHPDVGGVGLTGVVGEPDRSTTVVRDQRADQRALGTRTVDLRSGEDVAGREPGLALVDDHAGSPHDVRVGSRDLDRALTGRGGRSVRCSRG